MRGVTVQDLLRSLSWSDFWAALTKHYPTQRKARKGYRQAFFFVRECALLEDDGGVVCLEYEDGEAYVSSRKPADNRRYDISCLPLSINAGRSVEPEWAATNPRHAAHTAAHIVWEMTYYGFSDEQINGVWDKRRAYLASVLGK